MKERTILMEPALGWEGTVLYLDRLQILGLKAAARWDCTRHAVPNLPQTPKPSQTCLQTINMLVTL